MGPLQDSPPYRISLEIPTDHAGAMTTTFSRILSVSAVIVMIIAYPRLVFAQNESIYVRTITVKDDHDKLIESEIRFAGTEEMIPSLHCPGGILTDLRLECNAGMTLTALPLGDLHYNSHPIACHQEEHIEIPVYRKTTRAHLESNLGLAAQGDKYGVMAHIFTEASQIIPDPPDRTPSVLSQQADETAKILSALRDEKFEDVVGSVKWSIAHGKMASQLLNPKVSKNLAIVFGALALDESDKIIGSAISIRKQLHYDVQQDLVVMTDHLQRKFIDFQTDNGLKTTGRLDYGTVSALSRVDSATLMYKYVASAETDTGCSNPYRDRPQYWYKSRYDWSYFSGCDA